MKKIIRLTESDLKNIIKETLETILKKPGGDLEYLINICEEYDLNNIKLFFESVDTVLLERLLGTKIPKIDEDTKYVAEFILPNYGWGDKYACVLSALEFGGYGVSKNYICDIPYDMFHRLLNNFQFKGGKWVRNDNFNYVNESSSVSSLKKKMINKIYKIVMPLISSIYKDDSWQQVNKVLSSIETVVEPFNGELSVWCENGGYWKRIDEFPNYKEYKLSITFADNLIINGSLKCHSAGTMEDPFDRYDITLTLW